MAFTLSNVFNIADSTALELDGAAGLTTAVVGGRHLLFVAGADDDGLTSFEITKGGRLKKVQALDDTGNAAFELDGAIGVARAKVGSKTFLLSTTSSVSDNGISSFTISKHSSHLINKDNVDDIFGNFKLSGATGVEAAEVGGSTFMIAAGSNESGLSVFQLHASTAVISPGVGDERPRAMTW